MDKIKLPDIRIMARHGVFLQEKMEPQPFCIRLALFLDLAPAGLDDDFSKTIDYSQVYLNVKKFGENHSYNLIEALAENIAALILQDNRIQKVEVEVEKLYAKAGAYGFPASVYIERGQ